MPLYDILKMAKLGVKTIIQRNCISSQREYTMVQPRYLYMSVYTPLSKVKRDKINASQKKVNKSTVVNIR